MSAITTCGVVLTGCVLTSGCASLFARGAGGADDFYVGTKTDWAILTESGQGDFGAYTAGLMPLALLDLPLSMLLDTVLLPIDVFLVRSKNR
jgi:uncharacterized protein YceK